MLMNGREIMQCKMQILRRDIDLIYVPNLLEIIISYFVVSSGS